MKLNCVYCGDVFSVSAEQLGGRGRCPHCKEVVYLPKPESDGRPVDLQAVSDASPWRYLSAVAGAVSIHLVFLIFLNFTVWGKQSSVITTRPVRVKIGRPAPQISGKLELENWKPKPTKSASKKNSQNTNRLLSDISPFVASSNLNSTSESINSFQESSQSTLFSGSPTLNPDDAEDFGALLERLKRDGLDIVITFDSTGSMAGEIEQVKTRIHRIGRTLFQLIPQTRISIYTYRDWGDQYTVKGIPLTRDLSKIQKFLDGISAGGGKDEPEAVDEGLRRSILENQFKPAARKVVLVFGDAPPRDKDLKKCTTLASKFHREQGGVVSTVTCRNDQRLTSFVKIAEFGGGEAFNTLNEREIVSNLVVLVFGSQYKDKVLKAFKLLGK